MELSQLEWLKSAKEEPEWLNQVMEHGFAIHFIDGNRDNLEPNNLALVYSKDIRKLPTVEIKRKFNKSKRAYELRSESGMKWEDIARDIQVSQPNAVTMAKLYAKSHSLPWPIPF